MVLKHFFLIFETTLIQTLPGVCFVFILTSSKTCLGPHGDLFVFGATCCFAANFLKPSRISRENLKEEAHNSAVFKGKTFCANKLTQNADDNSVALNIKNVRLSQFLAYKCSCTPPF